MKVKRQLSNECGIKSAVKAAQKKKYKLENLVKLGY